jgi:hypothetical protein
VFFIEENVFSLYREHRKECVLSVECVLIIEQNVFSPVFSHVFIYIYMFSPVFSPVFSFWVQSPAIKGFRV